MKGDEKSLEILIKRYLKAIYVFVYRHIGNLEEAENITQEVFVRVWRNIHPVRSPIRSRFGSRLWRLTSNGVKKSPYRTYSDMGFNPKKGSFKTWIFSIARNASIDWLKKKKTIPFSKFENEEEENALIETLSDDSLLPDEIFEKAATAETLDAAMRQLSPQYRMVLFLRYNDDFTFQEIAEALSEPLDTVKSRHRRALAQLKKLLSDFPLSP